MEKHLQGSGIQNKNDELGSYVEPIDYNGIRDSVESLDTKLGIKHGAIVNKKREKEGSAGRCDRSLDKKDVKIKDLAMERDAEKDNYGNYNTHDPFDPTLFHMSSMVGIDLGCSIAMIDQNPYLISKMEQSRKYFYHQNIANRENKDEPSSPDPIGTGNAELDELCSRDDHSDTEVEMGYYDQL